MMQQGQVIALNGRSRNILNRSREREHFFDHIKNSSRPGWALIRVPAGMPMDAKNMFIREGFEPNNIFILGKSLTGVPANEQIDVDQFKTQYEQAILFDKKMIAITVAGVRAGINFGQEMKETLLGSWDSTVSNVAAIVQANIGRACGYHANSQALHFTNMSGVNAYADIVTYLEEHCTTQATDDLSGLRAEFEKICVNYDIKGLDVGARVTRFTRQTINASLANYRAYHTDSYLVVPGRLNENFDYSLYTDDPDYLETIRMVRDEMTTGGVCVKSSRSLPKSSLSIANWVNGDTFSNPEKAIAGGPAFERVAKYTTQLDLEKDVKFNDIIPAGGGIDINEKKVAVFVFSIFNQSRREVEKKVMTLSDVQDVADIFGIPPDDTILVLFKKGEYSESLTKEFVNSKLQSAPITPIVEQSKFQRDFT